MNFLKVYQIYYKPEQLALCEYTPLLNENCTPFFENDVIVKLIKAELHFQSEYFAVVSYKLREKIGDIMQNKWRGMMNIANHSLKEFSPHLFELELKKHRPDVMSFQSHPPHDPITYANQFHPWFSEYFSRIMFSIGFNWKPEKLDNVFYCNFFAAKSDIYHRYVYEMLIPAMEVMQRMPELMQDSKYPHKLPEHLQKGFGITWYPYHAFICERMFSYWAHINNLNCLHY